MKTAFSEKSRQGRDNGNTSHCIEQEIEKVVLSKKNSGLKRSELFGELFRRKDFCRVIEENSTWPVEGNESEEGVSGGVMKSFLRSRECEGQGLGIQGIKVLGVL